MKGWTLIQDSFQFGNDLLHQPRQSGCHRRTETDWEVETRSGNGPDDDFWRQETECGCQLESLGWSEVVRRPGTQSVDARIKSFQTLDGPRHHR